MIMGRNFDHTHFLVLSYSSTLAFMKWKYSRVLPLFCPTTAPAVLTIFVGRGGAGLQGGRSPQNVTVISGGCQIKVTSF